MPFLDGITLYYSSKCWRELETKIYVSADSGYLPSWCIPIRKGGFVRQEIKRLSRLLEFCRILFPSGGTIEWKTGFYFLARETGAKIFILGIDYSHGLFHGLIVVDSLLSPEEKSWQEIKEIAMAKLRTYPVRYEYMFFLQSLGIPYGCETFPISRTSIWMARGLFFLCLSISLSLGYIFLSGK